MFHQIQVHLKEPKTQLLKKTPLIACKNTIFACNCGYHSEMAGKCIGGKMHWREIAVAGKFTYMTSTLPAG